MKIPGETSHGEAAGPGEAERSVPARTSGNRHNMYSHHSREDGDAPSPGFALRTRRGNYSIRRTCSSRSCLASTVPGAPVIRSVPRVVLGKAMQSRMLVSPP